MTQGEALTILKTGANVFLTGEPGSGKTFVTQEFISWLRSAGIEPSITAATGIAATHINGMTLHSWSGIGVAESLSRADIDRIASRERIAKRIAISRVLIIDEVSMLSASTLEMVDAVCREIRRLRTPFGGLTVILVGDFSQLPPVTREGRQTPCGRLASTEFAFMSPVWRALNPIICYLTEQHRQDDNEYLSVLSAIRSGDVEELHYERLLSRQIEALPKRNLDGVPKLFSHNADVDCINAAELAKLSGRAKKFTMKSKGKESYVETLMRGCLSPKILELKEGAMVMFAKNSPQGKFVNGTLGIVAGWGRDGFPIVRLKNGARVTVEPAEWKFEEEGKMLASVEQVPLRLAYAITVHKSQGMSMDAAMMDLSRAFEYGQGYVALSRVRRLAGLYLAGLNARALEVHPDILEKDKDLRAASDAARRVFSQMPVTELKEMQERFVNALGGITSSSSGGEKRRRALQRQKGRKKPQ